MELFRMIMGAIIGIIGVIGIILSTYSVYFAGSGFVATFIIWGFDLSAISGWWVIGVPILMLVGGWIGIGLSMITAALGAALIED